MAFPLETTEQQAPGVEVPSSTAANRASLGNAFGRIWRVRGLWLGLVAVGCAFYGQQLLVTHRNAIDKAIAPSIRWYALGILLMLVAWWGTYRNKRCVLSPELGIGDRGPGISSSAPGLRSLIPDPRSPVFRYLLAFLALGLNLFSASQLRGDYYSLVGGLGWLASLLLLVLAFAGHRANTGSDPDAQVQDIEDRTDLKIPRKLEIALFLAICALGLFLRFYRLGDWATGFFPDEGYAGADSMKIVLGDHVSPFITGWYEQSNFYAWGVAMGMAVFGANLFGLRAFSALAGWLMLPFFYGLVRMWFGARMAIIATTLLAISATALIVSKEEFSNSTTPTLLVISFYFLFRGLRGRRTLDFVLAGYANLLSLYFYNGGRLAPILLIFVLAYLFLLMPIARLPGVYKDARSALPAAGRLRTLARAASIQARGSLRYGGQVLALVIACICFSSPFMTYFIDHREDMSSRSVGVLILDKQEDMASRYHVKHDPMYLGLRMPKDSDIYPVLPVVFEKTPISVMLSEDGFWPRVFWNQLTTTLSMLTYRKDTAFYSVAGQPAAKPIESALIVLGLAYALWRWRDARMAVLSMWFWFTVLVGGVLTVDAPYMPRLVGILPTLALFAAIPLNKLTDEFVGRLEGWKVGRLRTRNVPTFQPSNLPTIASGAAIAALLVYLGFQNYNDYFVRHVPPWDDTLYTGQAFFVQQMNQEAVSKGQPRPLYYDLAEGVTWWQDGANRFLNYGTEGVNMSNPADQIPTLDSGERDLVFMLWEPNTRYLPLIKSYYPGGEQKGFSLQLRPGDPSGPLLTYYRVTKEKIDERRTVSATYTPASGDPVEREEHGLGIGEPPANLSYPAQVEWHTQLLAPAFARYAFSLFSADRSALIIDGVNIVTTMGAGTSNGEIILARGLHDVKLTGNLTKASDPVELTWSAGGSPFVKVERKYLWNGPGRGLLAEIYPYSEDFFTISTPSDLPVVQRRVDGFVGFLHAAEAIAGGEGFSGVWSGSLNVTQAGNYSFAISAQSSGMLIIDDNVIIDDTGVRSDFASTGNVELAEGAHSLQLRYNWNGGPNNLELLWTTPDRQKGMIPPEAFQLEGGGAWEPGAIEEPPPYRLDAEDDVQPLGKDN